MTVSQRLTKGGRSMGAIGLMVFALLLSVLPAAAEPIVVIDDGDGIPAIQYAGVNRFDTAALIATDPTDARATFDSPTETVVVATGEKFPDAMTANYAAGIENSPILLSRVVDLTDEARGAIDDLGASDFLIVGGELAVDSSVETELQSIAGDSGTVTRVGGLNRAGTAAELARLGDADSDGDLDNGVTTAVVASDGEYAGALSAGPLAFAEGLPVFLSSPLGLSPETAEVIPELGITDVLIAGNDQVVPDSVVAEIQALGVTTSRVGDDMMTDTGTDTPTDTLDTDTDTSLSAAFAMLAIEEYGFSDAHINLATNSDFADALTIGAHAGADFPGPSAILLTEGEVLGSNAEGVLQELASDCGLLAIHIAGGEAAVPDSVIAEARAAGTCSNADRIQTAVGSETTFNHQQAFQDIAEANAIDSGNETIVTRSAGTAGYQASVDYVVEQLEAAGYEPTVEPFDYVLFNINGDLSVTIDGTELTEEQAQVMTFSGAGDVTAPIEAVDLQLDEADRPLSDSGCTNDVNLDPDGNPVPEDDFVGFTAGNIALVQRGACSFAEKAENAIAAGAVGVLVFNQGNGEDRSGVLNGTLSGPLSDETVPVFGTDFATGESLANDPTQTVQIVADVENVPDSTFNVIADTPYGDNENVVMIGAHLDSVPEGPGINDNGSGSAAILDVALQMAAADVETENTVRFAWWGAEELGLIGSTAYVQGDGPGGQEPGLTNEELDAIKLYLNFDMVSSPNYMLGVYDGDGSGFGLVGPPGSDDIESQFEDFFAGQGLPSVPTEFSGRSDYQAFINFGVPAGGLFTGAEGIKTDEEAALFGGEAGEPYDACYHLACDTIDNVNTDALDANVKAIARVTLTYADSLDGIPDRGAAATFNESGGQALGAHDHSHELGDFNDVVVE